MSNIIITGANKGIGFNIVSQLLEDNHRVAVFDIETDELEELKSKYGDNLLVFKTDVSITGQVDSAVSAVAESFGQIDIAIHNACLCTFDSMENTVEDIYKSVFDVNYFGALHLAKAVVPFMKKQHNGRIFFTSSGVGVTGFVNISPYASSKGAIESLAKCLNIEYRDSGISFHIFHPPLTRTASSAPLPVPPEFMADPEKVGRGLAKRIYKNRFIISNSAMQSFQVRMCYLFPVSFGRLLSKMTAGYSKQNDPTLKA